MSHKKTAAKFLLIGFGLAVLIISASTSFSFFYTFFGGLLPPTLVGPEIGGLISGTVGTLLFDLASSLWLLFYLNDAETAEQRAIALIMTVVTFVGAAAASVAHLGLTAGSELALQDATRDTVANVSLVAVIIGVVANFGAVLAYQRFSYDNQHLVRESDRRDKIQAAENEHAHFLDNLISQQVKEVLAAKAPDLARQQAERIAARFYQQETAKYASLPPSDNPPSDKAKVPAPAHTNGTDPNSTRGVSS